MESNTALTVPEIEQKVELLPIEEARTIQIVDDVSYQKGGAVLLQIKDLRKEINSTFGPIIKKAHEAHKEANAQMKRHDEPLKAAMDILSPRLAAYDEARERKRLAEEARLQEEVRKKAEEEKLEDAVVAEQMGQADVADNILAAPTFVPTVVVPKAAQPAGISYQEYWSAECFDLLALVKAVAANPSLLPYLQANEVSLNGQARSLKQMLNIPGVKAVCKKTAKDGRR